MQCQSCGADIHGYYDTPGVISLISYPPDSHCYHCGHPYPWNRLRIRLPMVVAAMFGQAVSKTALVMKSPKWQVIASIATIISVIAALV